MAKKGDKIATVGDSKDEANFRQNLLKILAFLNNNVANLNDTLAELKAVIETKK